MKIISQNVNFLRSGAKLQKLRVCLKVQDYEIACFQETGLKSDHIVKTNKTLMMHQTPELIYHDVSSDPYDHRGTTIILNKNHQFKNIKTILSGTGQFIILYCKYMNKDFILGNFYGHSSCSDSESKNTFSRFEAAFLPILYNMRDPMILVIGDFNCILSKMTILIALIKGSQEQNLLCLIF